MTKSSKYRAEFTDGEIGYISATEEYVMYDMEWFTIHTDQEGEFYIFCQGGTLYFVLHTIEL